MRVLRTWIEDGRRRPLAFVSALWFGLALAGAAAPAGAQAADSRVNYRISARLEGEPSEAKSLTGGLELSWTNRSGESVSDLWFHLYLNAFSNNRSTHMAEAKGLLRGVRIEDGWGWSRVTAVRVRLPGDSAWTDVTTTFRYRRPDDGRKDDRTVFSVDLPRPLGDGEELRCQVDWESQLPRVRRRTGAKDDFLLVAQWFPKLGVYEAGRGWNCHQFHMNSEFYSDYGTYDVTLDLPGRYEDKTGGSGTKELERRQGDRVLVRYLAPSSADRVRVDARGRTPVVHDFAWTGDPDYAVHTYTFRFSEWAERHAEEVERVRQALGEEVDLTLRDVDVTVLIQPEHADQADRHFKATSAALFFYGLWFGEYPYQHVTVVDPAWGAGAAAGMEYPTLFTCGTRLFTTEDMYVPESVTVHECGHQFWYGLVGNNEFEAAWLDEGFNSYTDSEVLWRVYGPSRSTTSYVRSPVDGVRVAPLPGGGPVSDFLAGQQFDLPLPFLDDLHLEALRDHSFTDPWSEKPSSRTYNYLALWRDQPRFTFVQQWTDPRWGDRSGYLADPDTDPVDTAAWKYADRRSYRTNSYPRTAVALRSLAGVVGDAPFLRGMRHYADRWRYRHPYPDDFFETFQEGAGVDCGWYFEELFRGTGTLDWSVAVDQARRRPPAGMFQGEGGAFIPRPAEESPQEEPWHMEITLRTKGGLYLPLTARLTFEDGSTEDLFWSREEQLETHWKRFVFERDSKLVSAVIDPERRCYLDRDMSNNQWFDATDDLAPWRWGERVLAQYQRYFHWVGGIGG